MSLTKDPLSLILLPTLECNAACEYCFEDKSKARLSHEQLAVLLNKVCAYMNKQGIGVLSINWQGGEVMMLPPDWYERAFDIIQEIGAAHRVSINHYIQTNLVNYSSAWLPVLTGMFNSSLGSSLDFPNLYRKLPGSDPAGYDAIMREKIEQAQLAGLHVGVIAVPNEQTLLLGARRFYDYYVNQLKFTDFQVNTPFAGGAVSQAKLTYPLDNERLSDFFIELTDIWISEGYERGIQVGPFDRLLNYFLEGDQGLLCIWGENCANEFFCIDPLGNLSQCDCWAASYPDFHFGNLLEPGSLESLLANSRVRQRFLDRPACLMEQEECIDCPYLSLCHGGCPVRAYTMNNKLHSKDPYCATYKAIFSHIEQVAAKVAAQRSCDKQG